MVFEMIVGCVLIVLILYLVKRVSNISITIKNENSNKKIVHNKSKQKSRPVCEMSYLRIDRAIPSYEPENSFCQETQACDVYDNRSYYKLEAYSKKFYYEE